MTRFRELSNGIYPLAVDLPTVGPGLTPRRMKSATKQFIRDELAMTDIRNAERLELSKSKKNRKTDETVDVEDLLMEDVKEGDFIREVKQGEDFEDDSDAMDEEEEDEETDDEVDEEEDDESDDEDEDDLDSSDEDEEDLTDEGDLASEEDEEEEVIVPVVKTKATKQSRKVDDQLYLLNF